MRFHIHRSTSTFPSHSLGGFFSFFSCTVAAAAPKKKGKRAITQADRVSVYVALAQAYAQAGQQQEAAKVMQDGAAEFSGTSEEVR